MKTQIESANYFAIEGIKKQLINLEIDLNLIIKSKMFKNEIKNLSKKITSIKEKEQKDKIFIAIFNFYRKRDLKIYIEDNLKNLECSKNSLFKNSMASLRLIYK